LIFLVNLSIFFSHFTELNRFCVLVFQNLRLYDLDASVVRLEANSEASLLDCCFSEDDSVAFCVASDGFIRRFSSFSHSLVISFIYFNIY